MAAQKQKGFFSFSRQENGFTLIELLVVIVIIGILSAIGIASFQNVQSKGRDAKRKADLQEIQTALQAYFNDYGRYPCVPDSGSCGTAGHNTPSNSTLTETTRYIKVIPFDPLANGKCATSRPEYLYSVSVDGLNYTIFANLENTIDNDAKNTKTTPIEGTQGTDTSGDYDNGDKTVAITTGTCNGVSLSASNGTYNYWVVNP